MDERNPNIIFFGAATLLLIIALGWMLSSGKVGLLAAQLEGTARKTQQVEATWQSVKSEEGPLTAFLFYNEAGTEAKYALFENRPGLSFGYFAADLTELAPMTAQGVLEDALVLFCPLEGQSYLALFSTNSSAVARVELTTAGGVHMTEVDPAEPFVLVLPAAQGDEISLYDENGQSVSYHGYNLPDAK